MRRGDGGRGSGDGNGNGVVGEEGGLVKKKGKGRDRDYGVDGFCCGEGFLYTTGRYTMEVLLHLAHKGNIVFC